MLLNHLSPRPFHQYCETHSFGGLQRNPIPPSSLHGGRSSFLCCVLLNDTVDSASVLSMVLTPSLLTPLKHQNWMHPLIMLILCLLQSLQVPILD